MENIFEGAKFGDKFKTEDGRPAVLTYLTDNRALLAVKDASEFTSTSIAYLLNGETEFVSDGLDIVSRWEEPIDEENLREKAYEWTEFVKSDNLAIKTIAVECAMIGYRKAKEE